MTKLYNRKNKTFRDDYQYGEKALKFLYNNPVGRITLRLLSGHLCSKMYALYNNSRLSKKKIASFAQKYNLENVDVDRFKTFSEFFSRRERRDVVTDKNVLISPADSKVLCYKIDSQQLIKVKNSVYSLQDLTGFEVSGYSGGVCLVFRLSMDDYHRYCFIDSGRLIESRHIKGKLHTVSSISKKYRVFAQNDRIVGRLETDNFGGIIQIEIGAMLVGRIRNLNKRNFKKGEEKGFFELGGSTIVILLKEGVYIDDDIAAQSENGIETIVKYGEKIGGKNV